MDWNTRYRPSNSLSMTISPAGELMAASSITGDPVPISTELLQVLQAFSSGAAPAAVLAGLLKDEWEIDEADFRSIVGDLVRLNCLTSVAAPSSAVPINSGLVNWHHTMLRDTRRVMSYREAIFRHAPGKTVLEIGCGSGILSILAAKAGARRVIAIEENQMADVAQAMFDANGCRDLIELRRGNSRDLELPEPVDLIVHEIIGSHPLGENILPVIIDARQRFLKKGGRLLPSRLRLLCMGVGSGRERLVEQSAALQAEYGVNFAPVTSHLAEQPFDFFSAVNSSPEFPLPLLTEPCPLYDIDLHTDTAATIASHPANAKLKATREGTIEGIVQFFVAHLDEQVLFGNAPALPKTSFGWLVSPLATQRAVKAGQEVPVRAELIKISSRDAVRVELA